MTAAATGGGVDGRDAAGAGPSGASSAVVGVDDDGGDRDSGETVDDSDLDFRGSLHLGSEGELQIVVIKGAGAAEAADEAAAEADETREHDGVTVGIDGLLGL